MGIPGGENGSGETWIELVLVWGNRVEPTAGEAGGRVMRCCGTVRNQDVPRVL